MGVPLTRFCGFLKRIDRSTSGPQKIILDKAFPRFWPSDPDSDDFQRQGEVLRKQRVDYVFKDLNPPRRFSGCWSLPRSRYFSICNDESGNDSHTLVNELNSYLDPLRGGLLTFADL